jgi:hypothetical protein
LGIGYAQKPFLGYSRKYSMKTPKFFFGYSSLIEVQKKAIDIIKILRKKKFSNAF